MAEQVMAVPAHAGVHSASPHIRPGSVHVTGLEAVAPASVDRVLSSPGTPLEPSLRQEWSATLGSTFPECEYIEIQRPSSQRGKSTPMHTRWDTTWCLGRVGSRRDRTKAGNYWPMS